MRDELATTLRTRQRLAPQVPARWTQRKAERRALGSFIAILRISRRLGRAADEPSNVFTDASANAALSVCLLRQNRGHARDRDRDQNSRTANTHGRAGAFSGNGFGGPPDRQHHRAMLSTHPYASRTHRSPCLRKLRSTAKPSSVRGRSVPENVGARLGAPERTERSVGVARRAKLAATSCVMGRATQQRPPAWTAPLSGLGGGTPSPSYVRIGDRGGTSKEVGGVCKASVRRPSRGSEVPRAVHPPGGDLQPAACIAPGRSG